MLAANMYRILALAAVAFVIVVSSLSYSTMSASIWTAESSQTDNIAWD